MTEKIYDQWGRSFVLPGPYDEFAKFYRLVHYGRGDTVVTTLDIRQPVRWDKLKIVLERSADWFGVNYEYSDPNAVCELDGYSGRDFVQSIFLAEGEDATVTIQVGITVPAVGGVAAFEVIEYEGRLNLSTYKRTKNRISVGLERKSLANKLQSRWDTAFSVIGTLQTPLSPQSLAERFESVSKAGLKSDVTFPGDTNGQIWFQFDTATPKTAEIEEFAAGKPLGLSDGDGPIKNDEWLFKFRSSGVFTVKINVDFRFWVAVKKRTISVGAAKITGYRLHTYVTHLKADGTRNDYEVTTTLTASRISSTEITLYPKGSFKKALDITKGDRLYIYGVMRFSHNKNELQQTQVQITSLTARIEVAGQSKNAASSAPSVTLFDAIDVGIERASDGINRLRSSYYGLAGEIYPVSGPGAERVLLNGKGIRNFKAAENPITIELRTILQSLQAIDAIGISYDTEINEVGQPRDVVSIKHVADFFRPVELLRFNSVEDYTEEVISAELYSGVEVGYTKWVGEGGNALEEVHTTHQLTTPFRNEGGKKVLTSKLLASPLAIERTRREQFADTPKDGTTYDDDVFIIQCKPTTGYTGPIRLYKGFLHDIIEVPEVIEWLTVGQTIYIDGSVKNDFPFVVTFISDAARTPWTFYVNGGDVFTDETVPSGQVKPSQLSPLTPEVGADLVDVLGLAGGQSAYNLRLTPGRLLFRTAPLWAGCLVDKADDAVFKAKIPQNSSLLTVIEGAKPDPMRVTERLAVDVDELIPRLLFRPRRISFSVRLSPTNIQRLRLGHAGLLPAEPDADGQTVDVNYGYISCLDDRGIRVAGWLEKCTWSATDEKVVLTLRQSALDLNDTTSGLDCAQFLGWTLDQAEQADAKTRRRIELCRYIDVDVL